MTASGVVCLLLLASFIVLSSQEPTQFKVTQHVYLDISIGGEPVKPNNRITIGVFGDITPYTTRNFVSLATNRYGFGYKKTNTPFHRVIEKFMIQGGDFEHRNGYGGYSIFTPKLFKDENFIVKHYGPGFVCMANAGPDTNGSQFVILTVPTPWSDNHYTCFGKVISGMEVVKKIEFNPTYTDAKKGIHDRPIKDVIIEDSGTLPLKKPYFVGRESVCW